MNVQITNAFSETYPNYSIDYRLFDISYYEKNRIYTREKKYVYLTRAWTGGGPAWASALRILSSVSKVLVSVLCKKIKGR